MEKRCKGFYDPLKKDIEIAEASVEKVKIEDEPTDEICEKCGSPMVIKRGRYGKFLACSAYPECKNTKAIINKVGVPCPECKDGDVIERRSRKGRKFYGCSNYPDCKFVSWYEPVKEKCAKCGSMMYKKYSKKKGNYIECSNPECKIQVPIVEKEEKPEKEEKSSKA